MFLNFSFLLYPFYCHRSRNQIKLDFFYKNYEILKEKRDVKKYINKQRLIKFCMCNQLVFEDLKAALEEARTVRSIRFFYTLSQFLAWLQPTRLMVIVLIGWFFKIILNLRLRNKSTKDPLQNESPWASKHNVIIN